jgi:hypothetical protein
MPWKLTVRAGPKVERSEYELLDDAIGALESRAKSLAADADGRAIDLKVRRFEPAQQVVARLELSGPGRLLPRLRAGVDVHGDGSTEAYLGHLTRDPVTRRKGDTTYKALRRAIKAAQPDG